MKIACENCKFFNPNELDETNGECRKNAPQVTDWDDHVWPNNLKLTDWCGEFEVRP